jgi:hypothetical protein
MKHTANNLSYYKGLFGIPILVMLQCAGTHTKSEMQDEAWADATALICVEDNLNLISIGFNKPDYLKFIIQCKDSATGELIRERELVINQKQNENLRAEIYDTIPCSPSVYYEIYGLNKINNLKSEVHVTHGVNLERRSKQNKKNAN